SSGTPSRLINVRAVRRRSCRRKSTPHLSPEPAADLCAEMTRIADELRSSPRHVEVDDQIAFCQLQRVRVPGLTKQQWLDLFELWRRLRQGAILGMAVSLTRANLLT